MNFILKMNFEKKTQLEPSKIQTNISLDSLDLGDITFEVNNKTIILIERKKCQTFLIPYMMADIKNKKKNEDALHKNVRKIYLIEGNSFFNTKLNQKTLDGIKLNTMLRDNFHIIHKIMMKQLNL